MTKLAGNGSAINLWTYNWRYHFPLYNLVPENQEHLLDLSITVDSIISNNAWNLGS